MQEILVENYSCDCSQRDIQRMELIIMQKLEFQLYRPTIDEFIDSVSTSDHMKAYTHTFFKTDMSFNSIIIIIN